MTPRETEIRLVVKGMLRKANRLSYLIDKYYDSRRHDHLYSSIVDAILAQDSTTLKQLLTAGLDSMTLSELRAYALQRGFRNVYSKTKGELICLLTNVNHT